MTNNEVLQKDVQDAIKWEPLLNEAEIGVTAKDGVITLTGIVDNMVMKSEVENAAKNTAGVKAIVEKIEVAYGGLKKGDTEIANEILNAFNWYKELPKDKVIAKVEDGWVTLEGELKWNYLKETAKNSICNIVGIKGVTNNIKIKSDSQDGIEKEDIERALERNWAINEKDIHVNIAGNKVVLNGTVHSIYQKEEAERIAWNAPGVLTVENELHIESYN